VNLSAHLVEEIERKLAKALPGSGAGAGAGAAARDAHVPSNLFDRAYGEISTMLQNGPFVRFNAHWKTLVDSEGMQQLHTKSWLHKQLALRRRADAVSRYNRRAQLPKWMVRTTDLLVEWEGNPGPSASAGPRSMEEVSQLGAAQSIPLTAADVSPRRNSRH
jgi:hypothetical protein